MGEQEAQTGSTQEAPFAGIEIPVQHSGEGSLEPVQPARGTIQTFLLELLHTHPGLIVTAGYVLMTAIGIVYDVLYYEHFRIPILAFSEMGDHLLAGFRRPVLLGLFVFSIFALWRLILRDKRMREGSSRYRALVERMERKLIFSNWVLYPMIVVIYFLCTTSLYAKYMAGRILEGHGKKIIVELMANGTNANIDAKPVLLIGTNSKFLFLFVPEERKATVVPLSSVSRMVLLSPIIEKGE